MKAFHVPTVNARYWVAITLASVFGTNLGDLYAHGSGLGIGLGLLVLAALAALAFMAERGDSSRHEAWYWLVIIIIRTGATNIADFLAFRVRIQPIVLALALVVLLAGFVWRMHVLARANAGLERRLPRTHAIYWLAMLSAGVLGTVIGDDASHVIGQGPASLVLLATLLGALTVTRGSTSLLAYWAIVGIARTAGTAMGDFLAENKALAIGLPLSTLITGAAFVVVLVAWRRRPDRQGSNDRATD
ncbi:putative membrane-anchored protein [Sphingomonas sp. F9_3S_D5_B_2]